MTSQSAVASPASFWTGTLLVVSGAVLLSAKGIFSKLLYAQGLDYQQVITFRSLISLPLFWLWGIYLVGLRGVLRVDRRGMWGAVAAGIFCYYIGGSLDFYALTLIDAGLERVLLYTYPAIIVLTLTIYKRRLPSLQVNCALLLTYTGVLLAVGVFDSALLQGNSFGASLVLLCALTYAVYFFANDHLGNKIGSAVFTVYSMSGATVALTIHFFSNHSIADFYLGMQAWGLLLGMAVFVTVVPLFMLAEGVKQIGAQRAGLLSTVGPLSTIMLAALILGEEMRWFQYLGVLVTLTGIVILEWQHKQAIPISD